MNEKKNKEIKQIYMNANKPFKYVGKIKPYKEPSFIGHTSSSARKVRNYLDFDKKSIPVKSNVKPRRELYPLREKSVSRENKQLSSRERAKAGRMYFNKNISRNQSNSSKRNSIVGSREKIQTKSSFRT